MRSVLFCLALSALIFASTQCMRADGPSTPAAPNAITPGEVFEERPTLHCLGYRWYVSGDENRNAEVLVAYRKAGDKNWKEALPLLRLQNETAGTGDLAWKTPNAFAGSILFLQPDTKYAVRLSLSDPDGGRAEKIITQSTRRAPQPYEKGRRLHVYPPQYTGEKTAPHFADLNTAFGSTQPGDVLLLHKGEYSVPDSVKADGARFVFERKGESEKPITVRAAGDGKVVLDGGGNDVLIDCRQSGHLILQSLTLRNANTLVQAGEGESGAANISVIGCKLEKSQYPIMGLSSRCRDFYIADNTLIGDRDGWEMYDANFSGDLKSHAVWLRGSGHIICHNRLIHFWDGIDFEGGVPPAEIELQNAASDFYGNEISECTGDAIELDYSVHNARAWGNKIYHVAGGISCQPVYGGPAYIVRNVVYNFTKYAIKPSQSPSGLMVFHNTFIGQHSPARWDVRWQNTRIVNNLFFGDDSEGVLWTGTLSPATTRLDYNGWRIPKKDDNVIWWKFTAMRRSSGGSMSDEDAFDSFAEFVAATGYEKHGVTLDYDTFAHVAMPRLGWKGGADFDARLAPNAKAIDAGQVLPNINDNFAGKAPDLGAYEFGSTLPEYGPRPIRKTD